MLKIMMSEMLKGNSGNNDGMSAMLPFMMMNGGMDNMFSGMFDAFDGSVDADDEDTDKEE